jgi:lysophospholipase L1-like esterase
MGASDDARDRRWQSDWIMSLNLSSLFGACGILLVAGCSSSGAAGSTANGGSAAAGAGANAGGNSGAGAAAGTTAGGGSSGVSGAGGVGGASQAAGTGGVTQAGGSAGQGGATPGPVGPRFIGRFDMSNPNAPVSEWSGTAVSLRFKGTAIGVTLTDGTNDVFEVVLDGTHTVVPTTGGTTKYMLGTGLSDGPHDLLLYRRTEAFWGDTIFGGFDVDPSAYLAGDPVPTRRLEVIGDSISAGYGDEGTYPCTFMPATEDHYLTYEALAARSVGADLNTNAWSGIGMLRDNTGKTTDQMPTLYLRTLPVKDTTSSWDFSKFVPDAVIINLGTNDFATGDPGMPFQATYTTFVTALRGHYSKARIFLAVGPMLSGASYDAAKGYLTNVIAARSTAGDKNLALLEFGTQDPADGLGCDSHPTLKTHQKMSDKLVAALKADLGW